MTFRPSILDVFLGPPRAILRIVFLLGMIVICTPIQIIFQIFKLPLRDKLPLLFHTILTHGILGMRVVVHGAISKEKPTLFLCNHLSYLDIPVLGSLLEARFVSKSEVARWPLFGFLAQLQNTVFVERRGRLVKEQGSILQTLLGKGTSLILFPEGTSTDGTVPPKPFRSSLLEATLNNPGPNVTIQPVSIACVAQNGKAAFYPWYGDMTLVPHLWTFFSLHGFTVQLTFHQPFPARQFSDRKALAQFAHAEVCKAPTGTPNTARLP